MERIENHENQENLRQVLKPDQLVRPFAGFEPVPEGENFHQFNFWLENIGNGSLDFVSDGDTMFEFMETSASEVLTPYNQVNRKAFQILIGFDLPVFKRPPICFLELSSLGISLTGFPSPVPDEEIWPYEWAIGTDFTRKEVIPVVPNDKAVLNDITLHFAPS